MINESIVPPATSLFEAILRFEEDIEYRLEKELMSLLRYRQ
jgi:hypothetical protein